MDITEKYMSRFSHLPKDRQLMVAMISAVDDGVGEITAELERQCILENTLIYFQSDNGPSRESRNWLDGNEDLYYGGSTGVFSVDEGCEVSGGYWDRGIRGIYIVRSSMPGHLPMPRRNRQKQGAMEDPSKLL